MRLSVHLNRSRHRLAKGAPNRNPEHESKRRAPSQQDADDSSAMPTAKFAIRKFYHWLQKHKGGCLSIVHSSAAGGRGERNHRPIALQFDDSPGTPLVA
jgi:hypothetical protein